MQFLYSTDTIKVTARAGTSRGWSRVHTYSLTEPISTKRKAFLAGAAMDKGEHLEPSATLPDTQAGLHLRPHRASSSKDSKSYFL